MVRPIPVPKVNNTNEIAAARTAPAMTAGQSMEGRRSASIATAMLNPPQDEMSAKTKQRQHGHDDDDEADKVDYAVHVNLHDVTELRGNAFTRKRFRDV